MTKKPLTPADYTQPTRLENIEIQEVNVEEIFGIVKNGNHYLITVTNQIVSRRTFATVDEAKDYIKSKPWELILNTTAVMWAKLEQEKQQSK